MPTRSISWRCKRDCALHSTHPASCTPIRRTIRPNPPAIPRRRRETKPETKVEIDLDGLAARIQEVPAPSGNYSDLAVAGKRVCWLDHNAQDPQKSALQCLDIANKGDKPDTLMEGVTGAEVSADGKKILIRKQNDLLIVDDREGRRPEGSQGADGQPGGSEELDLLGDPERRIPRGIPGCVAVAPRLFLRPEYARRDWTAMRNKYGELVDRVHDRSELSDLIAGMVSELSALHASVRGGDLRSGTDQVPLAALGALLVRERPAGGYLVQHVYQSDPDRPDRMSPLSRPGVEIGEGDVLLSINGMIRYRSTIRPSCCATRRASRCSCGSVQKARLSRGTSW